MKVRFLIFYGFWDKKGGVKAFLEHDFHSRAGIGMVHRAYFCLDTNFLSFVIFCTMQYFHDLGSYV